MASHQYPNFASVEKATMPGRLNKFFSRTLASRCPSTRKRLWLAAAMMSISLCAQSASANYLVSLRGPRDDGPNKIVLLGDDGHFIKDFVAAGVGGLHGPTGMAFGPDGNLYVANSSFGANNIVKFNGQTGAPLGVFASALNGPTGLRYNGNPGDPNF